ncbi:lysophospholipid acyltransferase family protein [Nonomuraea sp. NPDC050404]|uniref:lysophospholipid acyltransferase family protein n=1 Tax=Nonomuraea sp. NPDC050404 TaxID=3155783 RepID=UPI0034006A3C
MSTVLPPLSAARDNPWRPVSPCTPAACVGGPITPAGQLRRGLRLFGALIVALAGVPLALLARAFAGGTPRQAAITGRWARAFLRALGLRLEVIGTCGAVVTGALVVANHVSWLDPLVIAAALPARPLAKREIASWPVVRTLAAGSGTLFIDRERLSALPSAVAAVADALRAGDTVVAFPESTTWCGQGMGGFRPAVFQAAIDAGAPIRPVTLRYREGAESSTRAAFVGSDSLLSSLLRITATRHLVAEVRLPGLVLHAAATRAELARICETRVRVGLPGPHGTPPGREGV